MPRSPPVPPFPDPPQWVCTPTSCTADVWVPCPPSAALPSGETPRGISLTGVSEPTSRTQTEALLSPPPHITSPPFSYPPPPFPSSLPDIPIYPAPYGSSVPLPANCRLWTATFVPGTKTKRLPSVVSHTSRRPSSSAPPYLQPPTSFASSPSCAVPLLN